MAAPLRVLVVDDSPLMSDLLVQTLDADAGIETVGVAHDGAEAIEMVQRLHPDLVTMDVYMPRLDGFSAVEHIMAYNPTPILVITSATRADMDVSMRLLAAGALDVMEKPSRLEGRDWAVQQADLIRKVKLLAQVRVVTHLKGRRTLTPAPPPSKPTSSGDEAAGFDPALRPGTRSIRRGTGGLRQSLAPPSTVGRRSGTRPFPINPRYRMVAIASSTGGPQALLQVLQRLPANLPVPVLVVQHIASGFTVGLSEWLERECRRPVRVAQAGQIPRAGEVLIAPDDVHLLVRREGEQVTLQTESGPPQELRPAADMLFNSIAAAYGDRAIGVILTGMGRDGAAGLLAMHKTGAHVIAQDEATSVIFGMPKAAIALGATDEVLPLDAISKRLVELLVRTQG